MFISFVEALRRGGIPASLKEHLLLLEALDAEVIGRSPEDFYYLARSVFVHDESQLDRFDRIFGEVFKGLISEGEEMIKTKGDPAAIDAGLIAAAQRVEHYEIAGYGCVRTYAHQIGDHRNEKLLQQTLDEEGAADQKLTKLAEGVINIEAER